jgi:CRP-like cAMP-binding protein
MTCRDCRICHTQGSSQLLQNASSSSVERLAKAHESRSFPRGSLIYHQGSPNSRIYCISSGLVKVYHASTRGTRHILHLVGAGDFLGMPQLLGGRPLAEHSAEAVIPTVACQIEGETIMKTLETDPQVTFNVLQSLARSLQRAETRFLEHVNLSGPRRLANLLVQCSELEQNGEIASLSREEMAQLTGTTEALIARWIRLWVRKGFLKPRGTGMLLSDAQALLAFVAAQG